MNLIERWFLFDRKEYDFVIESRYTLWCCLILNEFRNRYRRNVCESAVRFESQIVKMTNKINKMGLPKMAVPKIMEKCDKSANSILIQLIEYLVSDFYSFIDSLTASKPEYGNSRITSIGNWRRHCSALKTMRLSFSSKNL